MQKASLLRDLGRVTASLLACAVLTACTTMQRVAPANLTQMPSVVRIGDAVSCTLQDGSRKDFTVTAVDASALHGDTQTVAVSEIAQIEIKTFSAGKTLLLGAAVVVTGAALVFASSPGLSTGSTAISMW